MNPVTSYRWPSGYPLPVSPPPGATGRLDRGPSGLPVGDLLAGRAAHGGPAGAGQRHGHRRPSRRHRVRVGGHAGDVGSRRLPHPPPGPHRRLQGELGPRRRHRPPGDGAPTGVPGRRRGHRRSGRPPGRARRRPGAVPRAGSTGSWRTASPSAGRWPRSSAPSAQPCSSATTRGVVTGSIPTIARRGSSPSMHWSQPGIRTSSRARARSPPPGGPGCCSKQTSPTISNGPTGSTVRRSTPCSATGASGSPPWASIAGRRFHAANWSAARRRPDRSEDDSADVFAWAKVRQSTRRARRPGPASPSAEAFHLA